jgi:hypothetical protein
MIGDSPGTCQRALRGQESTSTSTRTPSIKGLVLVRLGKFWVAYHTWRCPGTNFSGRVSAGGTTITTTYQYVPSRADPLADRAYTCPHTAKQTPIAA